MAREQKKVSLNDSDWDALFPQTKYVLGTTEIYIQPLSLESLASIIEQVQKIALEVTKLNFTAENFTGEESIGMIQLVALIIKQAPNILSDMSGVNVKDIQSLPLAPAVELFNKCLDVNIESQDSLLKNFKELGTKFQKLTQAEAPARMKLTPAQKTNR